MIQEKSINRLIISSLLQSNKKKFPSAIVQCLQRRVFKKKSIQSAAVVKDKVLLMSGVRGQTGWRPFKGNSNSKKKPTSNNQCRGASQCSQNADCWKVHIQYCRVVAIVTSVYINQQNRYETEMSSGCFPNFAPLSTLPLSAAASGAANLLCRSKRTNEHCKTFTPQM